MIDQRFVPLALDQVGTGDFERFAASFYGAIQDREFVPLGGTHDGGADGFLSPDSFPEVFGDEGATVFVQISKEQNCSAKVRKTIQRLRQYGRDPKVLTYITSRYVSDIDKLEQKLSDELSCKIAIRDGKYIEHHINTNAATRGAYESYLAPFVKSLYSPGQAEIATEIKKDSDRTLAVFLRQELEVRGSRSSMVESISDSLIIWALRDTDPDRGVLLSRNEILDRIQETLPTAKAFINSVFSRRLDVLASKEAPGGRQLRWYRRSDQYCLPYETRSIVAAENADDELLKLQVSCVFEDRLTEKFGDDADQVRTQVIAACHRVIERLFLHKGLKIAQFAGNAEIDDEMLTDVANIVLDVIDELHEVGDTKLAIRQYVTAILGPELINGIPKSAWV